MHILAFVGLLHLQSQSHICLTLGEEVNSMSDSTSVQPELIGGLNCISGSISGSTFIKRELIVQGGDQIHLWIHLQSQSHICLTLGEEVNSMSDSTSVQPELIGGLNCISGSISGSTFIKRELIVQGGDQIHLWIHLQFHMFVVPFVGLLHLEFQSYIYLTLGEGGSTACPAPPLSNLS